MKLGLTLAPLAGRLDQPVENSVASFRERRGWLVSVLFEGVRGLGEASPLSGYSSDTAEQTEANESPLQQELEGDSPQRRSSVPSSKMLVLGCLRIAARYVQVQREQRRTDEAQRQRIAHLVEKIASATDAAA